MNPKEKDILIQQMKKYGDKSEKLYQICLDDFCETVLDPTTWIYNQTGMRKSWENFKEEIIKTKNIGKLMLNCSFSKYMKFMYDTYPEGFGDAIKNCYENNLDMDGAEIFHKLITDNFK